VFVLSEVRGALVLLEDELSLDVALRETEFTEEPDLNTEEFSLLPAFGLEREELY